MANRVIRGYWDCEMCGKKGIDGLADTCPACGAGKSKNVRYYMKSVEEVTKEELAAAGISEEENDGLHREWVCPYCGNLNNYADLVCARCAAPKEEKEQDYGGDTSKVMYKQDKHGQMHQVAEQEAPVEQTYVTKEQAEASDRAAAKKQSGGFLRFLIPIAAILLLAILFWPHTTAESITGFEWQREVTVEELRTFSESGWSLPTGARQTGQRRELYGYQDVLDHYERDYVTKSREVFDHYDTSYEYTDNGNGTFSEHAVNTPVYRTEYYQEEVQTPVYRKEPVYQMKYYYDIDRWISLQTYETSGKDHDPYWSTAYELAENQRDDQMRVEAYYTIFNDEIREKTPYAEWQEQAIGDGIYVTKCLLGIEYSRKSQGDV